MNKQLFDKAHSVYPECFTYTHPESFNDGPLGGTNVYGDPATYFHPNVWSYIFNTFNVNSVVDIGCGFGYAVDFIKKTFPNIKIKGIEGSSKVVSLCLHPDLILQHDYNTGPCTLPEVCDLAWSTEFVEHVDECYANNFIETFKCCRYVAFSYGSIGQGGHHHVNENTQEYWINKLEQAGFEFLPNETSILKQLAEKDRDELRKTDSKHYIFHFYERGLFFKNKKNL